MHNMSPSSLALYMQLTVRSPCLSDGAVLLDGEGVGEDGEVCGGKGTSPERPLSGDLGATLGSSRLMGICES